MTYARAHIKHCDCVSNRCLICPFFSLPPFLWKIRCDLVIIVNGKKEKIASGLLNPFLAHLKTARDQMAKGGYSITLEPEHGCDATWFTRGTVERFDLLFNCLLLV